MILDDSIFAWRSSFDEYEIRLLISFKESLDLCLPITLRSRTKASLHHPFLNIAFAIGSESDFYIHFV